ncbi:MAG: cytochrome c biogenesis protein CcdA [Thermodesulfobacteriota bacterium]|nr:cytochrome c biogenesis protein CcdA [Thermodesulfobacteriota bacterium]
MAVKLGYKNVYRDPRGYPDWQKLGLPVETAPLKYAETNIASKTPGPIYGWGIVWTLMGIFVGGMALNLTPCVYPLIPVTLSYFVGQAGRRSQRGLIIRGLCYLLGLATTNSALGVVAALTGGLMGAILQHPIALLFVSAILIFFASSLFGFWELRLPGNLMQFASKSYTGHFGALFMGLTLGLVAAPCIGPFVLGLLTWVGSLGSPWLGFLVFFTLSMGLGLPLFFLAIFSGQFKRLPRSGGWMLWVRKLLGWVMVGMSVYFLRSLLPEFFYVILLSCIVLLAGLHLGWFSKDRAGFKAFGWMKTVVFMVCLTAAPYLFTSWMMRGPGLAWKPYSDQILTEAQRLKKPVIIDFYAEWCAPCRELDNITFRHPEVVRQSANDLIMVKVDLTRGSDSIHKRLLHRFEIKGVPTVVFLDREGRERKDLRLVDFQPADQFILRMMEIKR